MGQRRPSGRLRVAACLAGAAAVAACVDLFHSTDFPTLCTEDPAACRDAEPGDGAPVDAPDDGGAPIDFCSWSADDSRARAARACAWMGACLGALPRSSFGACVIRAELAYDCAINPSLRPRGRTEALWACLARAGSCAEVSTCVFGGDVPVCGAVQAESFTACSTDDAQRVAVECSSPAENSPPTAAAPCLLEGRACVAVDPSRATCAGKLGASCTGERTCSGTYAVDCASGSSVDVGLDCAAFGAGRCVEDDAGVACAPLEDAAACTGTSGVTCDDAGVARSCVGGRTVAIDCARLVKGCSPIADSGLDPARACVDDDPVTRCADPDACEGTSLVSCAQGKRFTVSCADVGLKPCVAPPVGRAAVAACAPP